MDTIKYGLNLTAIAGRLGVPESDLTDCLRIFDSYTGQFVPLNNAGTGFELDGFGHIPLARVWMLDRWAALRKSNGKSPAGSA